MSQSTGSSPLKPALSPSKSVSFEISPQKRSSDLTKSEMEAAERQKLQSKGAEAPKKAAAAEPAKPVLIDVDSHPLLANLKVDGKEVGAYMLCKFADDVLGHRARQIFREKASSIKGQNGIYYYLKDLMRKFSQEDAEPATAAGKKAVKKKKPTSDDDDVALEEHQFRKLMASDPAFECLVAQEDTTMLFQRIVNSATKTTMSHMDFVEFCLLDRMQLLILLCKYWKALRKLKLSDNELLDTYRRMTVQGTNESQMSVDLFGAAIAREFDVVLTIGEIEVMMDLIDYDGDGVVKPADFETFYKDVDRAQKLIELKEPDGIVDIKYSTNDNEAAELKREGYILYPKNIYQGHGTLHFWYKRARRDSGKPAIEAIQYSATNMDTALVSQGFVCMNGTKPFAKKYVWLKHSQTRTFQAQELGDIFITSGHTADEKSATLWMPPCRGYKQIEGTLDDTNKLTARWTTGRRGVFLWVRYMNEAHDVLEFKPPPSPTAAAISTATWSRVDELEGQIRQTLRRRCPAEADGVLNFLKLFQSFDKKNRKVLSANKLKIGLIALGCKMDVRLYAEVWKRVDVMTVKRVDFDAFQRFVHMTDTEIDDATEALQRSLTKGSSNYRSIFKANNAAGDGVFSRNDFLRMLASAQILVAPEELLKIIHRFDVNQDNVVDYADFLKFVTGVCDIHSRQAARVAEAAAAFQAWAIDHQNKKLAKDGNIDSSASWRLVKSYGDVLRVPMIDKILRQKNWRLDPTEMRSLCVLMSPMAAKVGEISRNAYHAFVNHNPKKIANLVVSARKVVGKMPDNNAPDAVFNQLNTLGHGKLPLATLHQEFNAMALEKSIPSMDMKDFVYLVQHTGADCGGDGLVILDRFLACLRDCSERRSMKHGFLTPYDSPQFAKGIALLVAELKRAAKTLDGKYDYSVPFKQFDKDNTQSIRLSDFETGIREMGVGKYLNEQEIKSVVRRFDVDGGGGIDFDEFCRFLTTEHGESATAGSPLNQPKVVAAIKEAFVQLPPYGVLSFANMIKRMCSMADKDGTGTVSAKKFEQVFDTLDIALPRPSKKDRPHVIQLLCDKSDVVPYGVFCDLYVSAMTSEPQKQGDLDKETQKVLTDAFNEIQKVADKAAKPDDGKDGGAKSAVQFDYHRAFAAFDKGVAPPDLKEVLWAAGVCYPFSPEELAVLHRAFQAETGKFDVDKFCDFASRGPSIFAKPDPSGKLDAVIAHLQDSIKQLVSSDKDVSRFHKLFLDFDADNDGSISTDEFLIVLDQMGLSKGLTTAEKESILHFFDVNGDGSIDYTEFFHFANHADAMLQTKVDSSKTVVPVNASPPKTAAATAAVSAPSSPTKSVAGSAPASPAKSAAKSPTKDNILALQQPNGKFTPLGKQLFRIAHMDRKLPRNRGFAFAKYFEKYKARHDASVVPWKKFRLILDKFLDTVLTAENGQPQKQIAHDVARVDVSLIEKQYVVRETGMVKYPLFLRDFQTAQLLDVRRADWSDDEDDDDPDLDDLSDSNVSNDGSSSDSDSDGGGSSRRDSIAASTNLSDLLHKLLQKANWSTSKCSKCSRHLDEWFPTRSCSRAKQFMVALRDKVSLPWKKSDLHAVATACRHLHHRHRVDPSVFVMAMRDALEHYSGISGRDDSSKSGGHHGANSTTALKPLMAKIYDVFLQAAQRNINGRQLLERCDGRGSGTISWPEFSTVLRLMECPLAPADLSVIQQALQSPSSCPYKSFFTLLETYGAMAQSSVVASSPRHRQSPSMLHMAPPAAYPPSPHHVASAVHALPPAYAAPAAFNTVHPSRAVEYELQAIFTDALRAIDATPIVAAFRKYDVKGCGFISLDGFHAAMRHGGIFLSPDVYTKIASQFAARFSDGIDYVEFCHVMGLPQDGGGYKSGHGKVAPLQLQLPPGPTSRAGAITPTAVESWLEHGASEQDKRHFNDMYNAIFEYKSKQQSVQDHPRPRPSTPSATASARDSWNCPVCFHAQSRAKTSCEICAAKNPAARTTSRESGGEFEVALQCAVCAFRNKATASACSLCQTPLRPQQSHGSAAPSSSSRGDGWLT